MTTLDKAREIVRTHELCVYSVHAEIVPILRGLILEIETLRASIQILQDKINDGRPV